jgi:hypothetical protein
MCSSRKVAQLRAVWVAESIAEVARAVHVTSGVTEETGRLSRCTRNLFLLLLLLPAPFTVYAAALGLVLLLAFSPFLLCKPRWRGMVNIAEMMLLVPCTIVRQAIWPEPSFLCPDCFPAPGQHVEGTATTAVKLVVYEGPDDTK